MAAKNSESDETFWELSDQHRSYLKKVVSARMDVRLASRVDESDIVQETLMEAMRRIRDRGMDTPLPLKLWLRQIAIDRVKMAERKHLRSQKRGILRETKLSEHSSIILAEHIFSQQSQGDRPEDKVDVREQVSRVRKALESLEEQDREILSLRTFEDLSYKEIEELTEVSEAAARKRYGRALARLHLKLKDESE